MMLENGMVEEAYAHDPQAKDNTLAICAHCGLPVQDPVRIGREVVCADCAGGFVWGNSEDMRLPYIMEHNREAAKEWFEQYLDSTERATMMVQAFSGFLLSGSRDSRDFVREYCQNDDGYFDFARERMEIDGGRAEAGV